MSLLDAWKTAFYHSSSYITQPIGDKSHEILCKLEDIQKKKVCMDCLVVSVLLTPLYGSWRACATLRLRFL